MSEAGTIESRHPLNPWQTCEVRIARIVHETPGVKTYDLEFVDAGRGAAYTFQPGQFNMLYVPGVGESAISISGRTEQGLLRHTIRNVGAVTGALNRLDVGMTLGLRGPFGSAWPLDGVYRRPEKWNVLLVAGGIGLAPLRSVITSLVHHRDKVDLVDIVIGARTPTDLLYADDYPRWADHLIHVETTVDRGDDQWRGHVGIVTLALDRLAVPRPESTLLMTCGPEVMMRYVIQSAMRSGIPTSNIFLALERNMNCAIGLCGHCQLGPEFVCKDGAVFEYEKVADWLRVPEL